MSSESLINPLKEAIIEGEELKNKEYELRKTRVDIQHKELKRRQEQQNAFSILPIGRNIAARAAALSKENEEYIRLAKGSATFLSMDIFKDKVALFPRNIILIGAETGTGKCFKKGTEVLMFDGSVKKIEDIVVGEQVMGPNSKPRNVLSLGRGREMMYDVIPVKGDKYRK